ncbi:hypothetical protein MKW94_008807, partial [Papaver nudicaule]|nr:hypothetical protein [Papaver nudicaule]
SRHWAFRAGFGLLHDLFAGEEGKKLVLNDQQRDLLATTPFWNLLQVFINNQINKDELEKPHSGLKKLTDSYENSEDGKGGFLVRKEERYEPTPEEMAIILGMQIVNNVFFTKTGGSKMPCRYLVLVESIDVINSISWPHLIHTHMMDSIKKSKGDYTKINGCAFYLLYWYAERSNESIKKRDGHEKSFPRFARWSTKTISTTIDTFDSSSFGDIKPNFGSQVEDDQEKTLVTPRYVKSQVEKLTDMIRELEAEVNDGRQKLWMINVKLREILKCLSKDPDKKEVLNILKDILKEDKEQPHREQEKEGSNLHKEQEQTQGQPEKQQDYEEDQQNSESGSHSAQDPPQQSKETCQQQRSESGSHSAHDTKLGQPAEKNKETCQQQRSDHEDKQKNEPCSHVAKDPPNLGQPIQENKETHLPQDSKQKEEDEEKRKRDLLAKELARKKIKEEEVRKNRQLQEQRKMEEEEREKQKKEREAEKEQLRDQVSKWFSNRIQGCKSFTLVLYRLGTTIPTLPRYPNKQEVSLRNNITITETYRNPSIYSNEFDDLCMQILNIAKKEICEMHPDKTKNRSLPLLDQVIREEKLKIITLWRSMFLNGECDI